MSAGATATAVHHPHATSPVMAMAGTAGVYDGYATIRARGLCRSRSIRAAELEAALAANNSSNNESDDVAGGSTPALRDTRQLDGDTMAALEAAHVMRRRRSSQNTSVSAHSTPIRQSVGMGVSSRRRTVSLRSSFSQSSSCSGSAAILGSGNGSTGEDIYAAFGRPVAKAVKTPTVEDIEPLYVGRSGGGGGGGGVGVTNGSVSSGGIIQFRPLSDASSSASSGVMPISVGSTAAVNGGSSGSGGGGSGGSGGFQHKHQKHSRFSLDSLASSSGATPKTPDYATVEDESIFLYTAPASPKRRVDSGIRTSSCTGDSDSCSYSPLPPATPGGVRPRPQLFERHEYVPPLGAIQSEAISPLSPPRRPPVLVRTPSNGGGGPLVLYRGSSVPPPTPQRMNTSFHSEGGVVTTPIYRRPPVSPGAPKAPIRRESLYAKPKMYATTNSSSSSPPSPSPSLSNSSPTGSGFPGPNSVTRRAGNGPRISCFQLPFPLPPSPLPQRSCSAELLDAGGSSAVGGGVASDVDDIIALAAVPSAMPMMANPLVDRRYHTLGHMRVHSLGLSRYSRSRDQGIGSSTSPMGSMLNMLNGTYYANYAHFVANGGHANATTHKSAGNIYASAEAAIADLNRLAPEYIDPLDFKIGCQTTLRSKPVIPWYELAIKRDFKRASCPPMSLPPPSSGICTGGPLMVLGIDNGSSPPTQSSTTTTTTRTSEAISDRSSFGNQAHVVSAFEQSLSNMTNRLHHLTATAERKDGELTDMRQTIELLRKQSIQAGLTTAHMQSMGVQTQGHNQNELLGPGKAASGLTIASNPGTPQHASRLALQQQQQQLQQQQQQQGVTNGNGSGGAMQRHHSSDSMCSLNSISSGCSAADKKKQKKTGWLRSSFTKAFSRNAKITKTNRATTGGQHHSGPAEGGSVLGSNAGLLMRNVATNGHGGHHNHHHHGLGQEPAGLASLATQPAPPHGTPSKNSLAGGGSPAKMVTLIENAKPIDAIDPLEEQHMVEDLKKQLREKDLVLTDIRLEALSSASQLESLKETVNKMRAEMMSLKQNNERLQKLVTTRSLAGSEASLGNAISPNGSIGGESSRRYSLATDGSSRPPMDLPNRLEEEVEDDNFPPAPAPDPGPPHSPTTHIDLTPPPPALEPAMPNNVSAVEEHHPLDVTDGKKIAIACYLGQPESYGKYCEELIELDEFYANSAMAAACPNAAGSSTAEGGECDDRKTAMYPTASLNEFVVAYTYISGKTTWQNLDYIVRKTFKDYVSRIDPGTNLGLNTDSITSYHLGEAKRGPEMGFPELLPCGYIVGNVRTLYICLQGVGSLAFDSLIPRSIVHRYISLLTEHRRLILCGPSGTGKSYLARRLAEFLVARSGRGNPSEAIATFNVDHKSSKELRQYLGHIAEQAAIANGISELPTVIILDNLHHASALGDVFSCLLSAGPAAKLPCIIGTMSQATCNTTNLQLHHNFRWVLTANHMEPVKGFLGRFLRRRLFQLELQTQHSQPELSAVLAWLPTVWQHINRFLETHSSSDVTIGPRLFLACPLDLKDSQVWFTDIWNYHLSPYLVEAVREGVQLYGRRGGAWNDPSAFIRNSYPWPYGPDSVPPLRQINAEDVGLEGVAVNNGDNQDPLLNMLMRLQEAANYSENQDPESDCASLDSNITPDSSAGAE